MLITAMMYSTDDFYTDVKHDFKISPSGLISLTFQVLVGGWCNKNEDCLY